MRWSPLALLLPLLMAGPARAAERLRTHLDCFLPSGNIKCVPLAEAYFGSLPFLEQTLDRETAQLRVEVRVAGEDERTTLYRFRIDGVRVVPTYARVERILKSVPDTVALLRALVLLQQLSVPQLALEEPGTPDARGRLLLVLGAPEPRPELEAPQEELKEPEGKAPRAAKVSGWYQSISLLGTASLGDNTTLNANLGSEVNYSHPAWRFRTAATADYQRLSVKLDDFEQTEELLTLSAKTLLARSLVGGLSVAVLGSALNAPAENLNFEGRAGLGVAWDLVPMMTQQGNSLGFQYVLWGTLHNYVRPNVLDQVERRHLNHSIDAVTSWHFERMDFLTNAGFAAILGDNRFHQVSGGLTWTYRVTSAFSISLTGTASYRRAVLNRPRETLIDSELEQYLKGGKFSTFLRQGTITFSYALGNAVLRSRDQRWRSY